MIASALRRLAAFLGVSPAQAQQWSHYRNAERAPRNLRKGQKRLLPSLLPDFSSDSRPQRFRAEFMVQYFSVRAKFDLPRRAKRLIARRRARAILRGEQVPDL